MSELDRLAKFFLREHPDWIGEGGVADNAIYRLRLLASEVKRLRELNHQVIQDEIEWRDKAASRLEEIERLREALKQADVERRATPSRKT